MTVEEFKRILTDNGWKESGNNWMSPKGWRIGFKISIGDDSATLDDTEIDLKNTIYDSDSGWMTEVNIYDNIRRVNQFRVRWES